MTGQPRKGLSCFHGSNFFISSQHDQTDIVQGQIPGPDKPLVEVPQIHGQGLISAGFLSEWDECQLVRRDGPT
jgi:hypothetical protein